MKLPYAVVFVALFMTWLNVSNPSIIENILVLLTLFAGMLAGGSFEKEGE
ncbi:hypothetical protein KLEB271_gp78 [Bacillus phage vB_BauS_KLEB27-1]|nr:hypothetical protein KLEB271_gp78 [Bacillus phage vB_BauS_KLEB27-1]